MEKKKKVHLNIKVFPRSRKQRMEETGPGEYRIWVISAPSKGEANREIIDMISSHFGVQRTRIRIVRGQRSCYKVVTLDSGEGDRMSFKK